MISSAAEEQAAAASEALRSVEQQTAALEESQSATQSLAAMASDVGSLESEGRADHLASAAEQLSTAVQELSGSAAQIMTAVEQISRGGQQQASATQEASAALDQIERMARAAMENATKSLDRISRMGGMLAEVRLTIGDLSAGVARALETTRRSLGLIAGLESVSRSVDKIVDGIGMVSIQTNMLAVNGFGRGGAGGRLRQGLCRRVQGYPHARARLRRECRTHQGYRPRDPGPDCRRAPRSRSDRSRRLRAENQKNAALLVEPWRGRDRHERDRRQQPADPCRRRNHFVVVERGGAAAPSRLRPWPRKREARRPRRRPLRGSRRAAPRISRQRSRRSHRWPKTSSAAMAKATQRAAASTGASPRPMTRPPCRRARTVAQTSIWSCSGSRTIASGFGSTDVGEIIRLPGLAHMPLAPRSLLGPRQSAGRGPADGRA